MYSTYYLYALYYIEIKKKFMSLMCWFHLLRVSLVIVWVVGYCNVCIKFELNDRLGLSTMIIAYEKRF